MRSSGDIAVHVIAGSEQETLAPKAAVAKPRSEGFDFTPYLASTAFSVVALAAALALQQVLDIENVALVFLTGVLASAVTYGLWPALYASLVSILLYNFFFLPPLYTFTIADPENVVALFFFLVVAVIASNLTARVRDQALTARQRAKTTEDLYLFSRKLAGVVSMDDLLWATAFQIASMLKVRVVLLLPEERHDRRACRLSAGGPARRGRPRRGQMGLAERPPGRAWLGHAAGGEVAVPADAHGARRRRRRRHR